MAQDIQEKLEKLHDLDVCMRNTWNKVAKAQVYMLSETSRIGPWYREGLFTTGSQMEGGFYVRMFNNGKHISEGDYMFTVGIIADPSTQLQPIKHLPGYVSVRSCGIMECFHAGVREKFPHGLPPGEFLSRSSVLNMTENLFLSTATKSRAYEFLADTIFQPKMPCKATVWFGQKGPSVVTHVFLTSANRHLAEVLIDTVPSFKLSSWPWDLGFHEFLIRERKWPSDAHVVEQVRDMVYIVAKSSPKFSAERERERCWRLSFSKAETFLMSLFTRDEKQLYLLFKILFYANIKKIEVDERTMASYLCKTTMLWVLEEEGEKLCKYNMFEAIRRLLKKFKNFLDSDNGLPNFFCPSVNLLEGYPRELVMESSVIAGNIIQRPLEYFPSNFDEIYQHLEGVFHRLEEIELENFADTLRNSARGRQDPNDCTAFELYWLKMQPGNWKVRLLFHPFVRAVMIAWAQRQLMSVRVIPLVLFLLCLCVVAGIWFV